MSPGESPSSTSTFRAARSADLVADQLAEASGQDRLSLDRLALAVSMAQAGDPADDGDDQSGRSRDLARIDDYDGVGPFRALMASEGLDGDGLVERARLHLNRGYAQLYDIFTDSGRSWEETLAQVDPAGFDAGTSAASGPDSNARVTAVRIPVGRLSGDGAEVWWDLNREGGAQTNANVRLAGMPGVGKSQFLLHLLAGLHDAAPDAGFIVLDYKGDLAANAEFVQTTGARVIRPGRAPIPINPFQLPPDVPRDMAPRVQRPVGDDPSVSP